MLATRVRTPNVALRLGCAGAAVLAPEGCGASCWEYWVAVGCVAGPDCARRGAGRAGGSPATADRRTLLLFRGPSAGLPEGWCCMVAGPARRARARYSRQGGVASESRRAVGFSEPSALRYSHARCCGGVRDPRRAQAEGRVTGALKSRFSGDCARHWVLSHETSFHPRLPINYGRSRLILERTFAGRFLNGRSAGPAGPGVSQSQARFAGGIFPAGGRAVWVHHRIKWNCHSDLRLYICVGALLHSVTAGSTEPVAEVLKGCTCGQS